MIQEQFFLVFQRFGRAVKHFYQKNASKNSQSNISETDFKHEIPPALASGVTDRVQGGVSPPLAS